VAERLKSDDQTRTPSCGATRPRFWTRWTPTSGD